MVVYASSKCPSCELGFTMSCILATGYVKDAVPRACPACGDPAGVLAAVEQVEAEEGGAKRAAIKTLEADNTLSSGPLIVGDNCGNCSEPVSMEVVLTTYPNGRHQAGRLKCPHCDDGKIVVDLLNAATKDAAGKRAVVLSISDEF